MCDLCDRKKRGELEGTNDHRMINRKIGERRKGQISPGREQMP